MSLIKKRVLLLGGNGRTGRKVIEVATSRGMEVAALVRNPASLQPREGLTVFEGTPTDADAVERAIEGADSVVSTLNNGRTSDFPWARSTSPKDLMEVSTRNAIAAMEQRQIRRIAVLSAAGVADSYDHSPWWFRMLIDYSNMKQAYEDHNAVDALLRSSDVDWTIARAMGLTNSPPSGTVIHSYANRPKPSMFISRESVAHFLLDSLSDPEMVGRAPVISEQ